MTNVIVRWNGPKDPETGEFLVPAPMVMCTEDANGTMQILITPVPVNAPKIPWWDVAPKKRKKRRAA